MEFRNSVGMSLFLEQQALLFAAPVVMRTVKILVFAYNGRADFNSLTITGGLVAVTIGMGIREFISVTDSTLQIRPATKREYTIPRYVIFLYNIKLKYLFAVIEFAIEWSCAANCNYELHLDWYLGN